MRSPIPLLAALAAVLLPAAAARAEDEVDPRYPFTAELAVTGLLFGELHGAGVSGFAPGVRATFLGPLAENVQGLGAFWIDSEQHPTGPTRTETQHHSSLLGGLRFRYPFERWATHVDTELMADVWPSFALGARGAFGGAFQVGRGVEVGAAIGVSFVVINPRAVLDVALTGGYSW